MANLPLRHHSIGCCSRNALLAFSTQFRPAPTTVSGHLRLPIKRRIRAVRNWPHSFAEMIIARPQVVVFTITSTKGYSTDYQSIPQSTNAV